MTKQLLICLFVVSLLFQRNCIAQSSFSLQQPPILPQAPNTGALGKFGDYPVSMFTGVPEISIPLYLIKTPAFEVPITLIYHASGIKLYDFPSWVGSGWALNAGGQIRRKMVGNPDEHLNAFMDNEPKRAANLSQYSPGYDSLVQLSQGIYDLGADIFSYNFPGGTGKFFFDRDSSFKPVLVPYAPIQVITGPRDTFRFDIKDMHGNFFQFGKRFQDFTSSYTSGGSPNDQVSAWMLEKMVSAIKDDSISFTYQRQTDITPWERSDSWTVEDQVIWNPYSSFVPYVPSQGTFTSNFSQSNLDYCSNQEISFKNGRVVFEVDSSHLREDFGQNNNSRRLQNIKVYGATEGGEQLLKTITFFHSYFGEDVEQRLKLDSIQVLDTGNVAINTYRFQYNTDVILPDVGTSTMCKDMWGYYNGKVSSIPNNLTLVPKTPVFYKAYAYSGPWDTIMIGSGTANSREPDTSYMQASILKRIYFPTGGYTDFEYETNRHLDDSNNVKFAGGLRVKSIKSYDGISASPLIKTYKYGLNESGVGRANYFQGNYFFYDEHQSEYHYNPDAEEGDWEYNPPVYFAEKRVRTYYSNPTIDIDGNEAPVVYPWVTEYIGQDSNTLGKTVYHFRDSMDNLTHGYNSNKAYVYSLNIERGQLLNKKVYKKTVSGVFQPLTEDRIIYDVSGFPMRSKYGGLILRQHRFKETNNPVWHFSPDANFYFDDYAYTSNDNYPISTTSIVYDAEDSTKYIETITATDYANYIHQQPTKTVTINSKGDTITTRVKYPADYITSGTTTGNVILDTMLQKNMQSYEVEKWQSITKSSGIESVSAGVLTKYELLNNTWYSTLVVPNKQSSLIVSSPITNFQISSISSGQLVNDSRYDTIINFSRYDVKGNILEVQKSNDIKESYLWAYNGAYPVAKITGAAYDLVGQYIDTAALYASLSTTYIQGQLSTLRTAFANSKVLITTLTYTPLLGLTSQTDPSGKTIYYEYDSFGRLRRIMDRDGNILKVFDYKYQTPSNQ